MRVLPGYTIALLLAVLLVGTTPVGTGVGIHQFDLVHPLFAHVHLVNGRVVTHDQMQRGEATARRGSPGPAHEVRPNFVRQTAPRNAATGSFGHSEGFSAAFLGAANAPGAADGDLGAFATDRPVQALDLLVLWRSGRTEWSTPFPLDRREAPPDPPPTSRASIV
jgi:hypothetical protein